ncbi:hypothetical protein MMUR_38130 [Mycolicibacterium murale]|uniref:DUF5666 domain-containing protein n=1 Tax=Mycolicibacterium murale TaxID=182220 RepID=A0A7I9WR54_9MYCO|nr:hypothetical protein [Mycolicibacterium murale]MCV7182767.1 hypothetical protein [Mycolicibacterium murale]GFG59677.1 hypothetical protein MMUR_38130 [Mycolicibacterium murale]
MRIQKPVLSISAVAVVGAGLWLANVAADPGSGPELASPPPSPAAATLTTVAPAPPPPPVEQFPTAATYSGTVTTQGAPIAVDITVSDGTARAYVCDGAAIETWMSGTVSGNVMKLASADGTIDATLRDATVTGTLTIGEKSWALTAPQVTDAQ